MSFSEGKKYYDVKEVLLYINQEQLFLHYLGILPNSSGRFFSPFRTDKNPGCRFSWHSGFLYLVENAAYKGKIYWNIFDCLKEKYNISFYEALRMICEDFPINKPENVKTTSIKKKDRPVIRFSYKDWPDDNLFMLSNDILQKENVFLVDNYWILTKDIIRKNPIHNPEETTVIAYYFPESNHVKLYFPEKEDARWYSNCDINDIFGKDKINYYAEKYNYLIITKSQKDRLTLDYHFNIPSIGLQNEGCFIPEEIVTLLKSKFEEIYILFDNDDTGEVMKEKMIKIYDFKDLKIPKELGKDSYDMLIKLTNQ